MKENAGKLIWTDIEPSWRMEIHGKRFVMIVRRFGSAYIPVWVEVDSLTGDEIAALMANSKVTDPSN